MKKDSSNKLNGHQSFVGLLKDHAMRDPKLLDMLEKPDSNIEEDKLEEIKFLRQMNPQYGIRPPSVIAHNSLYDLPTLTVVYVGRIANNPEGIEEYDVMGKKTILLKHLFTGPDEIFIGFGEPNVFTVMPSENGSGYEKLDAFMFYRKKARVARADQIQSGIYIRLRNITPEMLADLRAAMKKVIGKRGISCARSNADLLNLAGFRSGGKKLKEISPYPLFRKIVIHGLQHKGVKIHFDILNTTGRILEARFDQVNKKVFSSPCRAVEKSFMPDEKELSKSDIANIKKVLKSELKNPVVAFEKDLTHTVVYRSSRPSKLGAIARKLIGVQHIYHEVCPASNDLRIDDYLPNNLIDKYHRKEKTKGLSNQAKSVAFSKPIVKFLLRHLAREFDEEQEFTAKQLLDMLPMDDDGQMILHQNIVICGSKSKRGSRVIVTPIKVGNALADWILTKHLILSGYDGDVRFAGEGWGEKCQTENGIRMKIHISGDSGTYTPSNDDVKMASEFLQALVGEKAEVIPHYRN